MSRMTDPYPTDLRRALINAEVIGDFDDRAMVLLGKSFREAGVPPSEYAIDADDPRDMSDPPDALRASLADAFITEIEQDAGYRNPAIRVKGMARLQHPQQSATGIDKMRKRLERAKMAQARAATDMRVLNSQIEDLTAQMETLRKLMDVHRDPAWSYDAEWEGQYEHDVAVDGDPEGSITERALAAGESGA